MSLIKDGNWRIREPDGFQYSGYVFVNKDAAISKAKEQMSWHKDRTGFRWRRLKAKVFKTPDEYAVFVGKLEGQMKVSGKWTE